MKIRTTRGAVAVFVAFLLGSANAQVDAPKELEICKTFCTVTKKQCERDLFGPGLYGLGVAAVLGELNWRDAREKERNKDIASMTQLPKVGKSGDTTPAIQAEQLCETDRMQCAKDCAQPES
jgi:hypothetical protein